MKKIGKIITSGFVNKGRKCSLEQCIMPAACKTYCTKHYSRLLSTGNPLQTPTGRKHGERQVCIIDKCRDIVEGHGLCVRHYKQQRRHGKIFERTRYDNNEIISRGKCSEVVLYNKQSIRVGVALIDTDCVEAVRKHKWSATKKGRAIYVKTDVRVNGKRGVLYLPNLILGEKQGFQIDHISGDPLDNRRENLRFVTQQQNLMNKVSARGYSKEKKSGLWHTYIAINYHRIHLGRFKTEEEAKSVRREAELKYYGEFAKQQNNG